MWTISVDFKTNYKTNIFITKITMRGTVYYGEGRISAIDQNRHYQIHKQRLKQIKSNASPGSKKIVIFVLIFCGF